MSSILSDYAQNKSSLGIAHLQIFILPNELQNLSGFLSRIVARTLEIKPVIGKAIRVNPNYQTLLLLLSAQFGKDKQTNLLLK